MSWWTLRKLKSNNEVKRLEAVKKLSESKDAHAFEHLVSSLADTSLDVRLEAAQALGRMGDAQAAECLAKLLEDRAASVRQAAIEAIGKIGDEKAKNSLVIFLKDKDSGVRRSAAAALAQIESPEAKQALMEFLHREEEVEEAKRQMEEARAKRLVEQRAEGVAQRKREKEEKEERRKRFYSQWGKVSLPLGWERIKLPSLCVNCGKPSHGSEWVLSYTPGGIYGRNYRIQLAVPVCIRCNQWPRVWEKDEFHPPGPELLGSSISGVHKDFIVVFETLNEF